MERLEQMAKRWQERRRQIEEKDRRKLKKRLTIFLVLYLPVAVAVLVMGISGRVSAGKDKEQDVDTIEDFIESSQSDSIYTYEAGKEVSGQVLEEMSIPTDFPMDVMLTLLRFGEVEEGGEAIAGYFGEDSIQDVLWNEGELILGSGGIDLGPLENIPIIGPFIRLLGRAFFTVSGLWMIHFSLIILRVLLGIPFLYIELLLASLGPTFFPGSAFGVILGRVGSGGITSNYFGFELVEGNIYGIVGSILFGIFSSIATIGIAVKVISVIAGAAWTGGSGESRKKLKESLGYNLLSIVAVTFLPFAMYLACYIRDLILYEVLKLAEWASSTSNFAEYGYRKSVGISQLSTGSAQFSFLLADRMYGLTTGRHYNPFLQRAFDFSHGTLMDTLMYDGSVILLLVFMVLYISLALDTTISFAVSPVAVLSGKQSFLAWGKHMANNLLTPVIDGLVLCIPLLLGSLSRAEGTSAVGIGLVQLIICFSYFPLRKSMRARMNLNDDSGESLGMGSMMGAMMALRVLGNGVSKLAGSAKETKEQAAAATEGAKEATERADEQLSEIRQSESDRSEIDRAMKEIEGIEPDESSASGGLDEEDYDPGESLDDGDDRTLDREDPSGDDISLEGERNDSGEDTSLDGETEPSGKDPEPEGTDTELSPDRERPDGSDRTEGAGSLADQNIREAAKVSAQANALRAKEREHKNQAEHYGNQAALQEEMMKKDRAGVLSDEERRAHGYTTPEQAEVLRATYKRKQGEHLGQARRYGDLSRQAEVLCDRARGRMGISGHGALSAAEINRYGNLQSRANLRNFQSAQMQKSLSPETQAKLYLKAASSERQRFAAGVGVTTAMASVVGAGSWFLPSGLKAAGVGVAANLGASVMGTALSGENAYSAPVIEESMLAAPMSYKLPEEEVVALNMTGNVTSDPEGSAADDGIYRALLSFEEKINGGSGTVYGSSEPDIRALLYRMSADTYMERVPGNLSTTYPDGTRLVVSAYTNSGRKNTPIDLSGSRSHIRIEDLKWLSESDYAVGALCWYGDYQRELERIGALSPVRYPRRDSPVFQAILSTPQMQRQLEQLIVEKEGLAPEQITKEKLTEYLSLIERNYACLRELAEEECFAVFNSGSARRHIDHLFSKKRG